MEIWTNEQVNNLKKRQMVSFLHPYTCKCGEILTPTTSGFVCQNCGYVQDWAHGSDLNGEFKKWGYGWGM